MPSPAAPDLSAYPWIYTRERCPLIPEEKLVEILLVGDVMPGRGVRLEPDPFGKSASWLSAADWTVGNLEAALTRGPLPGIPGSTPAPADTPQPFLLAAPAVAAGTVAAAGFDLLGLANNHSLDLGLAGLAETTAILQEAGLEPFGAGPSLDEAYRARTLESGETRLAFLAFNAVPSPRGPEWTGEVLKMEDEPAWTLAGWDKERAVEAVRAARSDHAAVIVSIHWGYEYQRRVDPAQRDIAQALVEAGASLVVGHHPHVVQPVERIERAEAPGEALVAYSLGNFLFDQGFDDTSQGLALRAFFDSHGLRAVQALPVYAGLEPALLLPEKAGPLLERLLPAPQTLAFACSRESCTPTIPAGAEQGGIFSSAEADLTGDGRPERVTLEAGQVRIAGVSAPAWESPPGWHVLDLDLGDPDGDGRMDLLLALRKADRAGVLLSHPYLLGYRGGEYRLVWGGSAASDPLLEVELGDVDGDGGQELVVLEGQAGGSGQAVSVWRWHGWGFSQAWRSETGRYRNLRLAQEAGGGGLIIVVDREPG
jgi:poly-gamma-glutamate synthesis protein (capsule biosynthesis protein)